MPQPKKPLLLCILDGWGVRQDADANAVKIARTPFLDQTLDTYPHTELQCSGEAVGLPAGIMGNSEVGHLNIGAGRVVYQDLLRINTAIRDGSFFQNEILLGLMDKINAKQSALHLMGLVSDGGVHSDITHLLALLDMAKAKGITRTYVHAILDGRDTPPTSGIEYIRRLTGHINTIGYGEIASIIGRFYAMDRDTRWERVEKAYALYASGDGALEPDPVAAVEKAYQRGETDEFIKPIAITGPDGTHTATVGDDDGILFFNFRADRAREITRAFTEFGFDFFPRNPKPVLSDYVCMTLYDESFTLPMVYPPRHLDGILGQVISRNELRQLRIAETEKYAHVTYFFNGGEETPFPGEDRCLIPSPRDIATYDQKPEMSAFQVTEELLARLDSGQYDFIALNFANMDMVGHTGILKAAVRACETVDACMARIIPKVLEMGGVALITADHGNSERMLAEDGRPHTAHTLNPVHLVLVDGTRETTRLRKGVLGDIAPTILDIMGIDPPEQMTGQTLIEA
jgi:2,3-bisphosphoglycerate-independent phosphoglycerate mutase